MGRARDACVVLKPGATVSVDELDCALPRFSLLGYKIRAVSSFHPVKLPRRFGEDSQEGLRERFWVHQERGVQLGGGFNPSR